MRVVRVNAVNIDGDRNRSESWHLVFDAIVDAEDRVCSTEEMFGFDREVDRHGEELIQFCRFQPNGEIFRFDENSPHPWQNLSYEHTVPMRVGQHLKDWFDDECTFDIHAVIELTGRVA
ncbi:MAG: hypothetical protein AAGG06_17370 [Pseudomonadota bacterium]